MEEIWPKEAETRRSKNRHYSPNEFRQKIADMNPLFVNNQANDAKDLVNFIIMTLHEELNQSIAGDNINAMTNILNNNNNNNNNKMEDVFQVFYEEYQRTFKSKISELFYAISQNTTQCLSCKNCQYNFQAYFFLVFPLEEVKKYTINQILNNNNNNSNNNMNMNNNNMINLNNNMNNNQLALVNNMNNIMNNMNMINNMNMMMNNNMNNNMNMMNNNMNMMNNMMNNNMMNNMMNNNMNMNNMMNNMMNNNMNMNNMINNNMPNNMNMNNMMNNNNMNMNFGMGMGMPNMLPQTTNNMLMNNNIFNQMLQTNMNNLVRNNTAPMPVSMMNNINNTSTQNPRLIKLNNNIVSIQDCFEYNQKTEKFQDSNQIYCNACRQMADASYSSYLTTAPKILILLLNRGVGIQFKIKLEFTTELDITNYIQKKTGNIKYKLIGVITHLGESGEGGHFIAHCLSPIDNNWYTYNDAIVNETENFQKIIDFGMPYLLFYQKIE